MEQETITMTNHHLHGSFSMWKAVLQKVIFSRFHADMIDCIAKCGCLNKCESSESAFKIE